jgi:tetratricopeptide (TPR) repeat protein
VVGKAYEASKEGVGEDKDTDEHWVGTLVFGARMLLKTAGSRPGLEGIDDVKEAGTVLEKARTRLNLEDKPLLAKVLLAEGIYWSLLAVKGIRLIDYVSRKLIIPLGQEPLERSSQLEKAHVLLQESLLAHSTPSGYYHLALSFARRGGPAYNLDQAIECAGHAVAGQSDVRYWHLLGILLTGAEKWAEAIEILERGADLDEDLEGEGNAEESESPSESKDALTVTPSDAQTLVVPAVKAIDFLSNKVSDSDAGTVKPSKTRPTGAAPIRGRIPLISTTSSVPLLEPDATEIPLAETLLKSKEMNFEDYPASKTELFERHLQLRMTQVALMEVIEGAEGAESGWLEIFSWVAERKGPMNSSDRMFGLFSYERLTNVCVVESIQPRQSLEGPHRSVD